MLTQTDDNRSRASDFDTLRVFWQPGCSSCVKVKEYLASMDVDFVSVNILEDKGAMKELLARGIRSVPVLLQGDRSTYAQSLDDVAAFVGKKRVAERLAPDVLVERWMTFLTIARDLITQVPKEKLEVRPVPERPRTIRELSYHIFQIPESFLETLDRGIKDTRDISNAKYDHIQTKEELLAYAETIIGRMQAWRSRAEGRWFDAAVETYYGEQPMMQILERGTWHSGQHARQLDFVVSQMTHVPAAIPPSTYAGLPMPEGLWT